MFEYRINDVFYDQLRLKNKLKIFFIIKYKVSRINLLEKIRNKDKDSIIR